MRRWLLAMTQHTDILVAVGVVVILGMMLLPLPTYLLDFFLTLNISLALLVLMLTIYISAPLELSVFPGLLLVMTLFRLSLNVASTRLILSQADAGRMIAAFGDVVVRGNYVLGFIIFAIVVIIQFVVITKGAGRVAEVAARFTLDAMPGKQMAIDADLNAGLIDEAEARRRRQAITSEADFYGSMDGASKFVRGDAIAGILITLINIVGGLTIGVLQLGMGLGDAAQTYTLLTVGDGLVTQIPALITSTGAGIIVTRTTTDENMGTDMTRQLSGKPQAAIIAGTMLAALGLAPGLPTWPFALIGVCLIAMALLVRRKTRLQAMQEMAAREEEAQLEERPEDYLKVDLLEVQVGFQLVPLVDTRQGGDLIDRIVQIRKVAAMEMGFVAPPVRVRDSTELKPDVYEIRLKGNPVARGQLQPRQLLAIDPGYAEEPIEGTETVDPVFGLPARWINPALREKAELLGYNVIEPVAVLATHLTEMIHTYAPELLGRQETQHLLDELRHICPGVLDELVPDVVPVSRLQRVLQNLLAERVPIRDLRSILEGMAEYADVADVELLTEYVRSRLRRSICNLLLKEAPGNSIPVLTIDPEWEDLVKNAVQSTPVGITVALAPDVAARLFQRLTESVDQMIAAGQQPVVLASPQLRLAFRKLTAAGFPNLVVLSYNEITPEVEVASVGNLTLDHENPEIRSPEHAGSSATGA